MSLGLTRAPLGAASRGGVTLASSRCCTASRRHRSNRHGTLPVRAPPSVSVPALGVTPGLRTEGLRVLPVPPAPEVFIVVRLTGALGLAEAADPS
jgi:hypothetical protein